MLQCIKPAAYPSQHLCIAGSPGGRRRQQRGTRQENLQGGMPVHYRVNIITHYVQVRHATDMLIKIATYVYNVGRK